MIFSDLLKRFLKKGPAEPMAELTGPPLCGLPITEAIDTVLTLGLWPALQAAGYRRKGRHFYRVTPDCTCVVQSLTAKYSHGLRGEFYLWLGVYHPAVTAEVGDRTVTGVPKQHECTVRARLELLAGIGEEWVIREQTDLRALAAQVARAWENFGAPWMASCDTLNGLRATLTPDKTTPTWWYHPFVPVAVRLVQGDRNDAAQVLREVLRTIPVFADQTRVWAHEKGLAIE